jgi:outer membrane biosynthesis protein TonB
VSEIDLEVLVATNGTVSDVKIIKAPTPEIGSRFAVAVRAWIFEPYIKDGHRVQVRAPVKLSVQVIKSR